MDSDARGGVPSVNAWARGDRRRCVFHVPHSRSPRYCSSAAPRRTRRLDRLPRRARARVRRIPESRRWPRASGARRNARSSPGSGQAGRADNDLATYLRHPVLAANIMPFERYIANELDAPAASPRAVDSADGVVVSCRLRMGASCGLGEEGRHDGRGAHAHRARPGRRGLGSVRGVAAACRRRAACQRLCQRRHLERAGGAIQDSRNDGRRVHRRRVHDGGGYAEFNRRSDRGALQGQTARPTFRHTWPRRATTSG